MRRRTFLQCAVGSCLASPLMAAVEERRFDSAARVLADAVAEGNISAASIYVRQRGEEFAQAFGAAKTTDAIFLLASISKPISAAALMTLFDTGGFQLDDKVAKFIPDFTGGGREQITIEQLLTHISGLPDQLPDNPSLRSAHAPLSEYVAKTVRTPLLFAPGSKYSYSSMGILLASEIARRISGQEFIRLVEQRVLKPLGMNHSALGLGSFKLEETMHCQMELAAPEAGGGDPNAKDWDWNSPYWRQLGSPWGGVHASASDVAKFFAEFLHAMGKVVKPETARLMTQNHNPAGLTPRGLGFALGSKASAPNCSEQTFAHSGATGTLAWADPATDTVCVVLTTLPERAAKPHPMRMASDRVAAVVAEK
jgi:CubicO group peptidase (beta-lactamase class C family)